MNDYKNALKEVIETFNKLDVEGRFITRSNLDLLNKLVQRATPMRPKFDGFLDLCPICECSAFEEFSYKYCPRCGQAIDWEEEQE